MALQGLLRCKIHSFFEEGTGEGGGYRGGDEGVFDAPIDDFGSSSRLARKLLDHLGPVRYVHRGSGVVGFGGIDLFHGLQHHLG